jgi:energy-coupling factor transporter transmembrane protein EcfT
MYQKSFEFKAGVVSALMLLVALAPMPYGYYSLLRIVCFTYFLIRSIRLRDQITSFPFIASIILCLTYNPIVKASPGRETWVVINIMSIAIIIKFLVKNEEQAAR